MLSNRNDKRQSPLPPSEELDEKPSDHSTSAGEAPFLQSTVPPLPAPSVEPESERDYYRTPGPPWVARISTFVWEETSGPDGSPEEKSINSLGRYSESDYREAAVRECITTLESKGVKVTTYDTLYLGYQYEERIPIFRVGVKPNSLSAEDGAQAAIECKKVLDKNGLFDVHCEIREADKWPDFSKTEEKAGKVLCRKKKRAAAKRAATQQKKEYEQWRSTLPQAVRDIVK